MSWGKILVVLFAISLIASSTSSTKTDQATVKTPAQISSATSESPSTVGHISNASPAQAETQVTVGRVVDGDTVELSTGEKVRYIGINTPEVVDPRKPVQCFGVEASQANKSLVLGKTVRLEKDVSETDKYGRRLRYVWVRETLVNDYLVRQGYARASSYPPDVKYQAQFTQAETEARDNNRGLWSACSSSNATVTQPTTSGPSKTPPDPSCPIKGNLSSSGKIYHVPGGAFYDKTVIDPAAGERWFCSEAEAQAAGWRRSQR